MSMTTYEGRISRPLTVRIFPEVTAEEAALLMSTAQSSSSSLDETSCVSVLLSVLQTPAPLPRVVAGSQGYTQRACNQLSCQALNHLFSPEGYFQAAWPRKDNVSEPRSKINADISEQLAQPPAWPLAPCPWDNTSSSPRTWIWLLYLRNSFFALQSPGCSLHKWHLSAAGNLVPHSHGASFLHTTVWILWWEDQRWQK